MNDHQCVGCGAPSNGVFVCHHCGVPVRPLSDAASQRQALDELHGQLGSKDRSPSLLVNAFLPDDPRVLIDAGLRLLPVLEESAGQSGAAGRMRAIIIKLRLLGNDPTSTRAAAEFEAALEAYRRSDRMTGYAVWMIALGLVVFGVFGFRHCG